MFIRKCNSSQEADGGTLWGRDLSGRDGWGGKGMLNAQQPSYILVCTWLGSIKSKFGLFSSQHFGSLCNAWMEFYTFMQTCSLGGAQMLNNFTTLVFFS